jgi:hypothetical protein
VTELKDDCVKPVRGALVLAAESCYPCRRDSTITGGQQDVSACW